MARREFEILTPQMFYILLALNQPRHGYDIMAEVARMTNNEVKIGAGTLYTLLPKFQNDGYIQLILEKDRKKIYQITKIGQKKLAEEIKKMDIMKSNYEKIFVENHGGEKNESEI